MKWLDKSPLAGDMVRVKLGSIYHYGVCGGDDEIIQFGLAPAARPTLKDDQIEVCTSDIEGFLCGGCLEVAEFEATDMTKRNPEDIVAYARKNLGRRGYNIIYSNCEHFAYECVVGKPYCSQTDGLRAMFRSLPLVAVYVAQIPEDVCVKPVSCVERELEISSVNNPKVKIEKYCVWKLLEYALERSFGLHSDKVMFTKTDAGKWITDKCSFSLSHSASAVAVAVSRTDVGIDIEEVNAISNDRFANKILNEAEYGLYEKIIPEEQDLFLLEKWTAKESLFKKQGMKTFDPRNYDTLSKGSRTQQVSLADNKYLLSVATDTPEIIRTYVGIDLNGI